MDYFLGFLEVRFGSMSYSFFFDLGSDVFGMYIYIYIGVDLSLLGRTYVSSLGFYAVPLSTCQQHVLA